MRKTHEQLTDCGVRSNERCANETKKCEELNKHFKVQRKTDSNGFSTFNYLL